ncbi:hypothetical protein O9K51_05356 [Purpureocillium lavendulum]|uniref:YAG7-like dimerisation domain-containing protein n=1 Tax=Purpureocillium lavendulum TaxID=1247861 RepID=A0AB34FRE8_9HYPO|nr:hypothetical protein O9K51_05356 [Purpureocillium lavendulum]
MATSAVQNPSTSSKKKAARAIERTDSPAPSTGSAAADKASESQDEAFESPYIKELQKNIRNNSKKVTHASKIEAILSQHKGKTLDDLIAARVINADQKAAVLKKPALEAQVAQYEEQLAQYQKVHEQYRARAAAEKADYEKSLEKARTEAAGDAKADFGTSLRDSLLTLSQFLRLAAYRREEANDPESDESQAIEGVLLAIYSGDDGAVASMLKLIEGSEDQVLSVPGEQLQTTYASVKTLAREYKTPFYAEGGQPAEAEPSKEVVSDPTMANVAATEIAAGDVAISEQQKAAEEPAANGIANANVSDEAANAVAESHWDGGNDAAISQEWVDVKVPRDPAETETGLTATPAAATNTQSWADDQPEPASEPAQAATADPNDGFHQVQRNRGRQEREGGTWRGRGRGEYRGRGRGDGRGRGRGRGNGGVPSRGPRRTEES